MAILLSVHELEKSHGAQLLFRGLSFGIQSLDRVGLIGPNGAGKSTLLRILAGLTPSDGGKIVRNQGLRLAFLEQAPSFHKEHTIFEAVSEHVEDDRQFGLVQTWLARLQLHRAQATPETPVADLSGGWKKKVALVRELVRDPDLLLLDEPTNHLDMESILWLEELLTNARFATLTITHDRLFLERVANRILELDRRNPDGLLDVKGSYTQYLEAKEALLHAQARRQEVVENTLRRETEWLRRGAKARQTKQKARIERAGDLKDEVDDLSARNLNRAAQLDFKSAERNPQKLIVAKNVSKSYGRKLFGPLDVLITPKTRLGLLGPNGSGKSTLIRVLLKQEEPDDGVVEHAEQLKVAYFAQHRDELDPNLSVLQTICPAGDYVHFRGQFIFARSYLDRFLFGRDQVDMPVGKLSGGEKSRLRLAQMMLEPANIMVLDEPTNDLDLQTLNVLENAIKDFDGAVLLVSHDRYFLDQVSNDLIAFTQNKNGESHLERFAEYSQWEEWLANQPPSEAPKTQVSTAEAKAPPKKKLGFKEKRELESMESTILEAEARLKAMQTESSLPEVVSNAERLTQLCGEMAQLEKQIERLYARWAELESP